MFGEKNVSGSGEYRANGAEFLQDQELMQRSGDKILQIVGTDIDQLKSIARRKFVDETARQKNDEQVVMGLEKLAAARDSLLKNGDTAGAAKLDEEMQSIQDIWKATNGEAGAAASEEEKPVPTDTEEEAPTEPAPAEQPEPKPEMAPVVDEPDYEELSDWSEQQNHQTTEEEIESILTRWDGEKRTVKQAIADLKADLATAESEVKDMKSLSERYLDASIAKRRQAVIAEAQADILSIKRKIYLLEHYTGEQGAEPELPTPAAEQAAGGELDDLAPEHTADEEAIARRVLDWSEAKYLYDARGGEGESDAALKALYLKERSELMKDGMSREEADAAIMQSRGLTAEDIARLNYDVEDESDEAHYIEVGEKALAESRKMAEEMRRNQEEGKAIVLDVEFAQKLGALRDQLAEAKAAREQMADDSEEAKNLDAEIYRLTMAIDEMEEHRAMQNTVAESVMLNENPEIVKKSLFEKLKGGNGLGRFVRSIGTKVATLAFAALIGIGAIPKAAAATPDNAPIRDSSIEMKIDGAGLAKGVAQRFVEAAGKKFDFASGEGEVNLTRAQLEAVFGEEGAKEIMNLSDAEYREAMGYKTLENGVPYSNRFYDGEGGTREKVSAKAVSYSHEDDWDYAEENNGDVSKLLTDLYLVADADLNALAMYSVALPSNLKEVGLRTDLKASELAHTIAHDENGAELREKLLEALKKTLEDPNTTIAIDKIDGKYWTDYEESPEAESPADREIKYNLANRKQAKVFVITKTITEADGTTRTEDMVITATCMQTNVARTNPPKTSSGKPVTVTVVEIIDPTDTGTPPVIEETTTGTPPVIEETITGTPPVIEEAITGTPPVIEETNTETPPEKPGNTDPGNTDPGTPPETNTPEVSKPPKNQQAAIENANRGGTGTITQRGDYIDDEHRTSNESSIPPAGNQQRVEQTMVGDQTKTKEEQENDHREQEEANKRAEQIENKGPMSNADFESLMDYLTSQTNNNANNSSNDSNANGNSNASESRNQGGSEVVNNEGGAQAVDGEIQVGGGSVNVDGPTGTLTPTSEGLGEATVDPNGGNGGDTAVEATGGTGAQAAEAAAPAASAEGLTADPNAGAAASTPGEQGDGVDYEGLMDYYNNIANQ